MMFDESQLLGWIDAGRTWPGLDPKAWVRLIAKLDVLAPMPPQKVRNPFTGGMSMTSPNPTSALVKVGRRTVGQIILCASGPRELLVWGDAERLNPIVRMIAAKLHGSYYPFPRTVHTSGDRGR